MVFTAFPSECDSHGAVLDEQRQRIQVERSPVSEPLRAERLTMAEAADKHPVPNAPRWSGMLQAGQWSR